VATILFTSSFKWRILKIGSFRLNMKINKNNHQKSPNLHCIMVLQVVWYAECNESQIKCIKHMLVGHNPKWHPNLTILGLKSRLLRNKLLYYYEKVSRLQNHFFNSYTLRDKLSESQNYFN